jgi:molybdopterin-guanine dinucleotide biosynthesis protein A
MPDAAILAGGRARRFDGHDKSALIVGGRTILERQVSELSQVAEDILLVGSNHAPATGVDPARLRLVSDRVPDSGPLGGLDAALSACRTDTLIVVACDMPFISARLLDHLAGLAANRPQLRAVVPKTKRGYHPLCAVYTRGCQDAISRHIAERRLALVDLLDALERSDRGSVQAVTEQELVVFGDPDRLLANINTPTEYDELEALSDHRP